MPEGLAFDCDAETLARANVWNLTTDAGRLDLIFKPGGTQGYDDLARSAVTYQAFGIELRAASLNDILRSKLASNRAQDQQDVIILTEMMKPLGGQMLLPRQASSPSSSSERSSSAGSR